MISLVFLASLLIGVDVACGKVENCGTALETHILNHSYTSHKDYKGVSTEKVPLPRVAPFTDVIEEDINKQINRELFASYTYQSMAIHFDRDDINLPGFHKFFQESSEEEMKHAQLFMEYQNKRGGRVKLRGIMTPCKDEWGSGLDAMKEALSLEKHIYQSLLDLHKKAGEKEDPQLQDFLDSHYLGEQIDSIKQLSNYVNTLTRLNGTDGSNYALGEFQFDKITLGGSKSA